MLRPQRQSPKLPKGVPFEVSLTSLADPRGLRASLVGVRQVVHLASAERTGNKHALEVIDQYGTRNLAYACADAGVDQIIFVSHLGADRHSAYPVLRAKGIAEQEIRRSGVPYTIFRSSLMYGERDHFTTTIARVLGISPLLMPIPGDGSSTMQPLWVEDMATLIGQSVEDSGFYNQVYEIGGPEFLSFREILEDVMIRIKARRVLIPSRQPYLKAFANLASRFLAEPLLNPFFFDYLTTGRTASLETFPRLTGQPAARMQDHLSYLTGKNWTWEFLRYQFRGQRSVINP
jgi:NADH dehydrogenase